MEITKELKFKMLKILKQGIISNDDKNDLVKLLGLPQVQIEVIDKREQVKELINNN